MDRWKCRRRRGLYRMEHVKEYIATASDIPNRATRSSWQFYTFPLSLFLTHPYTFAQAMSCWTFTTAAQSYILKNTQHSRLVSISCMSCEKFPFFSTTQLTTLQKYQNAGMLLLLLLAAVGVKVVRRHMSVLTMICLAIAGQNPHCEFPRSNN